MLTAGLMNVDTLSLLEQVKQHSRQASLPSEFFCPPSMTRVVNCGHRLYEAGVTGHAQLASLLAGSGPLPGGVVLSREAKWCMGYWEDLLQDVPPEEVQEMKQVRVFPGYYHSVLVQSCCGHQNSLADC